MPLTEICSCIFVNSDPSSTARRASHLASHRNLGHVFEADGRATLVRVVKYDGDARARYAGLAALVNQVEQVRGADLSEGGKSASATRPTAGGRTVVRLVIPRTKQIESRMLDLPEPFLRCRGLSGAP